MTLTPHQLKYIDYTVKLLVLAYFLWKVYKNQPFTYDDILWLFLL